MIWDALAPAEEEHAAILSRVREQISAALGEDSPVSGSTIEDLAHAVATFLEERKNRPVTDGRYVAMLSSRAMSSIGQNSAARRLLLFGTGLVRPSEWIAAGEQSVWVLDLRQITVRDDAPLELVFFNCLGIILDSMVEAWDESGGQGILGLSHVCRSASALLGKKDSKKISELAEEIVGLCRDKLEQARQKRGWESAPLVMNLDS